MSAEAEARAWLAALAEDASIHVHRFDLAARTATLVRLSEAEQRAATFLDDRALRPDTPGLVVPLDAVLEAALALPATPFDALFHVGHCGSTLVSRLIGALPANLPRREPLWWLGVGVTRRTMSRSLTPRAWDALWTAGRRSLARRFAPGARVLLKSTSVAGNLLGPLLVEEPAARAVLLTTDLEDWLANILRDPDSRADAGHNLRYWAPDLRTLTRDDGLREQDLNEAERLTVNWLAPMLHFEAALAAHPGRVRLLRFADVLAMPRVALAALSGQLGLGATSTDIAAVLAGPLLGHYAKQPERAYDARERAAQIAASKRENAATIHKALDFAARYAADSPLVAAHLRG